jgi:germination protein M
MRKSRIALLCAAALLLSLLTGCAAQKQETGQKGLSLYYLASPDLSAGGDAIAEYASGIEADAGEDVEQLARTLTETLLQTPEDPTLSSPFPGGTQLLGLRVSGKQAQVDLSSQYARLSGVELSLADYCLTLTLTQLDGVNAVSITANGRALPYRKTQLFTAADPLLSSREDALRPVTVQPSAVSTASSFTSTSARGAALVTSTTHPSASSTVNRHAGAAPHTPSAAQTAAATTHRVMAPVPSMPS